MAFDLFIDIKYPVEKPQDFKIESNIKEEKRADILMDFLRSQMGAGVDGSVPNEHDVYHIRIELDLTEDTFRASSNVGNLGLRDGILMDIVKRLG